MCSDLVVVCSVLVVVCTVYVVVCSVYVSVCCVYVLVCSVLLLVCSVYVSVCCVYSLHVLVCRYAHSWVWNPDQPECHQGAHHTQGTRGRGDRTTRIYL